MIIGGYKNVWTGVYQGAGSDPISSKQRYVDAPHKRNRPGVTMQQLKSMVKRSWGGEWGFDRSFKNRDPAKVAPVMGEVEEYAEGTAL